jgi:hypothetical protein
MTIAAAVEPQASDHRPDEWVADHLASQLRSSRLTVLYGAAANNLPAFIATSVAPRLGRRRWDRSLTRARQNEFGGAGLRTLRRLAPSAELPVVVDRWAGPAIPTLQRRISDSFDRAGAYMTAVSLPFADSLSAWSQLLDLRFLIIFDRFEEFLAGREDSDDGRRFTRELIQVLRKPDLAVNFLVCAAAGSEPEMQRYQMQFAELEQASCVRVPLHRSSRPPSACDLTLIEWRDPPFARAPVAPEPAAHNANPNRRLRARRGLRSACAATIAAIAVFCWPVLQPDLHFDVAGSLALAARAVERGVSELFHRIEGSLSGGEAKRSSP